MAQNYGSLDRINHEANLSNITQRIRNNLHSIRQLTQTLNDIYSILGGPHDSSSRQDEIHRHQLKANQLLSLTKSLFESMSQIGSIDQDSRVQIARVHEEYQSVINKYGETQKKIMAKLNQIVQEKRQTQTMDSLVDTQEFTQSQIQINENEDDLRLAAEVEQRVRQLENDLVNVQKMFTDINEIVVESREKVEQIEDNVAAANTDVESGNYQLRDAILYKRKALKKKIILFIVVLVLLIIIGIIIWVSVKKK